MHITKNGLNLLCLQMGLNCFNTFNSASGCLEKVCVGQRRSYNWFDLCLTNFGSQVDFGQSIAPKDKFKLILGNLWIFCESPLNMPSNACNKFVFVRGRLPPDSDRGLTEFWSHVDFGETVAPKDKLKLILDLLMKTPLDQPLRCLNQVYFGHK